MRTYYTSDIKNREEKYLFFGFYKSRKSCNELMCIPFTHLNVIGIGFNTL